MIKSEVKKKTEASATITNTMIVVIVVSRRDGQVTLAVSLRTSCMNLNGLKAIVDDPCPPCDDVEFKESKQPERQSSCAQPSSEDEPPSGPFFFREIKAASDIRQGGPTASAAMYCGPTQRSRYRAVTRGYG